MNGILTRNEDDIWMVKWSDLHSFEHGTHWMFTRLSPDSNSIRYIKDNQIMVKPLEEGLEVEFEMVTSGYDENNFTPFNSAKLMFTEVDNFEKEEWIKEYVKKSGGKLYSIDNISVIRDGGTIMLIRPPQSKLNPIYIHKDYWTVHSGYPTTNENLIIDKPEQVYILDRLEKHRIGCEHNLKQVNRVIEKIKFETTM
tara:strand:- start:53 stop:643 length:591 start_codon:yes stop_codon:yes gene_type:complete